MSSQTQKKKENHHIDHNAHVKNNAAHLIHINKKLHEKERRLRLIVDNVPALVSYVDARERYRFCNSIYEKWFGIKKEELYGKTILAARGKDVYKTLKPHIKTVLSGQQVTFDASYRKEDGSIVYFTATYSPHFNAQGKVIGFFILGVDITERKITEERLREKDLQFRHLVEANVIGVVIKSLDGQIFEANDIFLQMVGYTREDLEAGRVNWIKMTPPEFLKVHQQIQKEVLAKGAATPFEKEYIRKDGTRISVLVGDVLLDKKQRKTITFILDLTKQKELNKRKDEFIALASHELKTPLASLKMYAQLIQRTAQTLKNEQSARLAANMDTQIDKLTDLVNDLLDVSRIQAGKLKYKKENFVFDKLIYETIDALQRVTQHRLIVEGNANATIRADRDRIKQVLTNLITNATKYSPKAKKVFISIRTWEDAIQVGIEDFGIGIPIDQQRNIFDRFFQVDRPLSHTYPGLGLGLFITKEIIDRHQGNIWVESKQGKGSTFYFTLPLKPKANKKNTA